MTSEQHFGTRSTFGPQVLSHRPSSPTSKFGLGGRTTKIYDAAFEAALLGQTSPGATGAVVSSLGVQPSSRCRSAPAHRVPKSLHCHTLKGPNIGPGHYNLPVNTLGIQLIESQRPSSSSYKLGSSTRWPELKPEWTGKLGQPVLASTKIPVGYLGDAPAWTFHGPRQSCLVVTSSSNEDMSCYVPPTSATAPGPAAYATELSSFGRQVSSNASTSPTASIPRSTRDKFMKQTLPHGQEHALLGRTAPGPCCAQVSSLGRQVVSRARSASGVRFGSSDRFSDTKPVVRKKISGSPGTSKNGGSSSAGNSSNGSRGNSSTGSSRTSSNGTARSRPGSQSGAGSLSSTHAAWPYDSPGPGAYVV